ncbi:MAG: trypsin-like peptidase domain-containing protein [Oscillospiraceae bacterium]|nr:trypsin-like peptidase domain-containing protein [Oscillospiraceae bacterium]
MSSYENNNSVFNEDGTYRMSHYSDPEIHEHETYTRRSAYSDAGYVSSDSASAVPPRYHCNPDATPKKVKARLASDKKRRGMSAAGIVALCLVCSLLGGVCGFAGGYFGNRSTPALPDANESADTVINFAPQGTTSDVITNIVYSGEELSGPEIYALGCKQTVAITTEVTTNYWGFVTSTPVSGSGFIISENGYILTNHHVISDAISGGYDVNVYMNDGTMYIAEIVGYEEDNDIAVLKIDAEGLSAVTVGDSDAMLVGETARVIGNPLGELQYSMTSGEVSALDREISTTDSSTGVVTTINMFQIDAAVNGGNSGGPVYNSRGEVIGVVTAKYSDTGVEGLGFAIPINDAISIAEELITKGYVSGKAYMGIKVQTISVSVAQYYNMAPGAYVASVEPGSCSEKAGLQEGDIIVQMGDVRVTTDNDLISAKKAYRAGDTTTLTIYRDGKYIEVSITFDEEIPAQQSAETQQSQQQQPNSGYPQRPGW